MKIKQEGYSELLKRPTPELTEEIRRLRERICGFESEKQVLVANILCLREKLRNEFGDSEVCE